MNKDQKCNRVFLLGIMMFMISGIYSYASAVVVFGPKETQIKGSIKYSVIGRYNARFSSFKGKITLAQKSYAIESVYLEIDTESVQSNCPWCDRIVRSEQLLAARKYPKIIFTSKAIIKNKTNYTVDGILELHGVKNQVRFPFEAMIRPDKDLKEDLVDIQGQWQINRKAFNIIWNKFLDQGGILVGNYITVDWGIKAGIQ